LVEMGQRPICRLRRVWRSLMKVARNIAGWPALAMIAVGITAALLISTETARSAERDRAATAADRAARVTGTGPAATTRKDIKKKKQQDAKKNLAPPQ
jgi:hypothetical protein